MADPKTFVPTVFGTERLYGLMLVELARCAACDRYMVARPNEYDRTFPRGHMVAFDAQLERADWRQRSWQKTSTDNEVCKVCAAEDKSSFRCELCEQERPGSLEKSRRGDGALCTTCYKTVTAERWQQAMDKLEDEHRYDYE